MPNLVSGRSRGKSYLGTNAYQPPNMYFEPRNPRSTDKENVVVGDFWLNIITWDLFFLASLAGTSTSKGTIAHWILIASGTGDLQHLTAQDLVVVYPQAGNINIVGDGVSINTTGDNVTGTITISAIGGVILDTIVTNAGIISPLGDTLGILGGQNMNTSASGDNVFIHLNPTVVVPSGGGIRFDDFDMGVVQSDASGNLFSDNGPDGYFLIGGGDSNIKPTWGTITTNTPDEIVISSGYGPGNIPFINIDAGGELAIAFRTDSGPGNDATPDNSIIKIVGGLNITTSSPGAPPFNNVVIELDDDVVIPPGGSLTVSDLTGPGFVRTDNTGKFEILPDSNTPGAIIIASSVGNPAWSTITPGANISINNTDGNIQISATGGGGGSGIAVIHGEVGDAFIDLIDDSVNVFGDGGNIETTGDNVNTLVVSIINSPTFTGIVNANGGFRTTTGDVEVMAGDVLINAGTTNYGALAEGVAYIDSAGDVISTGAGTSGQILIGRSGLPPIWNVLTSSGGSVAITLGSGTINLEATGVAALTQLTTDNGVATPLVGNINVLGGDNINTDATIANTVTVHLDKSIFQPVTNASGSEGLYALGGFDFMHNFSSDGTNTFLGKQSGNRTLTTAVGNLGLGYASLNSLTTGSFNVTLGGGLSLTTGSNNVIVGFNSGGNLVTTSNNIIIGNAANVLDNNVIRIGSQGVGPFQQANTYVAGIYQATTGATYEIVRVDSVGKLSSFKGGDGTVLIGSTAGSPTWGTLTAGAGITITNGPNSIIITNTGGGGGGGAQNFLTQNGTAVAGSVVPGRIVINGGENINTTGATDTVVVNLNRSISWPPTAVNPGTPGGYEGIIFLNSLLFMSARGTRNTFLGEAAGNLTLNTSSGTDNAGIGSYSMTQITTGQFNSALGSSALLSVTTGKDNVAVGRNSLLSLTTASDNVSVGSGAMDSAITATRNVAVGRLALATTTAAQDVTAVGWQAANALTTANQTTAVGSEALANITTGLRNTAVGYRAGFEPETTTDNTYIGFQAARLNNNGSFNTVVGSLALEDPISLQQGGSRNIAIGYKAAQLVNENDNVVIGNEASANNKDVVIGNNAAQNTLTISGGDGENVIIGHNAAKTPVGMAANVIIGKAAAENATGTYGSNIIIGYHADQGGSGHVNNIYIGRQIGGPDPEQSTIRLGDPTFNNAACYVAGIYNRTIGNPNHVVSVDSSGKLGIPSAQSLNIPMFLYKQDYTANSVTGQGQVYYIGTFGALTKIFDAQNNITRPTTGPNANRMLFTTPVSGVYQFQLSIDARNILLPPPPPPPQPQISCPMDIITTKRTYDMAPVFVADSSTVPRTESYTFVTLANMDAGDTCVFAWSLVMPPNSPLVNLGPQTFIGGFLVHTI